MCACVMCALCGSKSLLFAPSLRVLAAAAEAAEDRGAKDKNERAER